MSISSFLSPIEGGRMSSQIIRQVVRLIREGRLMPGDRMPAERELATTFGVSRVTVRDALRALEAMGLIEIRVGSSGGAFVTKPSPDVVGESVANILMMSGFKPEEIAETRLALELGIFDLAARRLTAQDIEDLRAHCRETREDWESGNYDTSLASKFHLALARGAHNPAIAMMAESFSGALSMAAMRAKEVRADAKRKTLEEHEQIVEALARGDIAAARKVLVTHLLRGRSMPEDMQALFSSE